MRPLNTLRGLRFPDDYVVRAFFKEGLHRAPGRVLELGCGSGNNLLLYRAFGWGVVGIDVSRAAIKDARHNLEGGGGSGVELMEADLALGLPAAVRGEFEAILLPSFNYYVPRASFEGLLGACRALLKSGGLFFIRSRTRQDWRYGRGREVAPHAFILDCTETGEHGLLNVFYDPDELVALITSGLGTLERPQILRTRYENPQMGAIVTNDEVVIWGRLGSKGDSRTHAGARS